METSGGFLFLGWLKAADYLSAPGIESSRDHERQNQRGIKPPTPNEQSIRRHQNGIPRIAPNTSAHGITSTHAISPKSNSHRLRAGSRQAPTNASAITKCPKASQSVP